MDLSLSFLLFYGGLCLACLLLLYKSIRTYSHAIHTTHHNELLYSWHVPNLKKWKQRFYNILYWIRDISFRYWAVNLLSYVKLTIYKLLRVSHKRLLGIIKYLERHEDQLKERLADQSRESRSATEQRLIRTLSKKRYPSQPINSQH